MKTLNVWKCKYCKSTNTDLKNKAKDRKIKCLKCGKLNKVPFESDKHRK
jgi:translation initiation factor 2 beta subunit (eIF-2beta)/eIF-5